MRPQAILCLLLQLSFELSSCAHLQVIPGSSLDLPCLSIQTEFTGSPITWTFNGIDINDQPPVSTKVKQNGLFLSISSVTTANQGEYRCLVKESTMEIIREYTIIVDASINYAIKVIKGSTAHLPCHFPPSSQVEANALWFRNHSERKRPLSVGDGSSDDNNRLEQLYPGDTDQTIIIKETVFEDTGTYFCESEGKTLSTVHIIVEVPPTLPPPMCSMFPAAWEPCQDERSRTGAPMLQESMAEFSLKLYSHIRQSEPSSNLLFSPISISSALSHLLLGARDVTRKAIETAVCVPHDFHCVHFQMKKLRERLAGSLQMASQIYYNPEFNLTQSFTDQSIQYYEAAPVKLLEGSEESAQMINSWVANKTNNKIKKIVNHVSESTQLILLNAVSFSGQWKVQFNQKPKKGFFSKLDGDLVSVPVLFHDKYELATKTDVELKAQVARFLLTGNSSLYILLPRTNTVTGLQQMEEKMTDLAVRNLIEDMKTVEPGPTEVTLPQIKLDVEPNMNIALKKLGLSSLFENANLCGLSSEERLVLDDAKHRAFLALTEEGVEAGAVTSVSFSRSFPSFSAMRPFVLMLWSDQANVPLFIGRVTDP